MAGLADPPGGTGCTHLLRQLSRARRLAAPATRSTRGRGRTPPHQSSGRARGVAQPPEDARHYSYRTECSYTDWARRFFDYLVERQSASQPRVDGDAVRDFLAHLALHRHVSASTQNQAGCAILFLCREVLGLEVEGLSDVVKARRGSHLPVVLSVPETGALLGALEGTPWLMAALIYGGGLRVSECCALRIKDLDFDQGLMYVRSGKGNKDRTTLLAEGCREPLEAHLQATERLYYARFSARTARAGKWLRRPR